MTRERKIFSSEFKLQMVRLYENGKPRNEIVREYDLTPSALGKWIKQHQNTGSFNHQDNLSDDEKELIKLHKEVQHLKMENDILKQANLIVTLCSDADKNCPILPPNVKKEHWGFDDPAGKTWTEFQRVRDEIKLAIENFKTK